MVKENFYFSVQLPSNGGFIIWLTISFLVISFFLSFFRGLLQNKLVILYAWTQTKGFSSNSVRTIFYRTAIGNFLFFFSLSHQKVSEFFIVAFVLHSKLRKIWWWQVWNIFRLFFLSFLFSFLLTMLHHLLYIRFYTPAYKFMIKTNIFVALWHIIFES